MVVLDVTDCPRDTEILARSRCSFDQARDRNGCMRDSCAPTPHYIDCIVSGLAVWHRECGGKEPFY